MHKHERNFYQEEIQAKANAELAEKIRGQLNSNPQPMDPVATYFGTAPLDVGGKNIGVMDGIISDTMYTEVMYTPSRQMYVCVCGQKHLIPAHTHCNAHLNMSMKACLARRIVRAHDGLFLKQH